MIETHLKPEGYRGDRDVGRILNLLRDQVIERPELNTNDALTASVYAIISEMKRSTF